jgi:hypothetical protein
VNNYSMRSTTIPNMWPNSILRCLVAAVSLLYHIVILVHIKFSTAFLVKGTHDQIGQDCRKSVRVEGASWVLYPFRAHLVATNVQGRHFGVCLEALISELRVVFEEVVLRRVRIVKGFFNYVIYVLLFKVVVVVLHDQWMRF